ncbi:hypothetical protein GXW71_28195 [Roseomonas hellenica]|uniref:Large polyvalent protein associated domain-containing protein n=1 Tax=Plastoroseomonas hellenica TaxID=2687306 RepID=A0ABS5F6W2_9PROT|nr:hypothetical protein [Plastoroseomonas hellenica]MBR0668266.1 hypothetical protein [Plastoroseomonas hellenica]
MAPGFTPGRYLSAEDVDRRSGAPSNVRRAVGNLSTPEDRLAMLRRFAPDARPFGDGNFIYTDRRTGRPTVYNPQGLDVGDVFSIGPEIGEFVGGAIGGALAVPPAVWGIPATGGLSVLAVPAGVGLGAAAGREISTATGTLLDNAPDSRGFGERAGDAATTAGLNAVGVPVGNLIARGIGAAVAPVRRFLSPEAGQNALRDFANAGVDASAGAVTGNRTVQMAERGLGVTPGGAQPVQEMAERQAVQMRDEAQRIAAGYAPGATPEGAGAALREGARNAVQRFETRQERLYDEAYALIPSDARATLPSVAHLGGELRDALAQAPESRDATLRPVIERIQAALADAGEGGVPFQALRDIRSDLGKIIGGPPNPAGDAQSATVEYLRRFYGALSDDMTSAARAISPAAQQRLAVADRYFRLNRTQNLPTLERVLDQGTDEQVFRLAFPRSGQPDAQAMARLRRNMEPEEWRVVAATVVDRMGIPTAGQRRSLDDFSVSTFLTNWNRLITNGVGARRVLFGGNRETAELATDLDRLVRVAGRLRDADRMANPSGTARNLIAGAGMLSMGQDAMEGDWRGVAYTGALGVLAPRYVAQLMTSPQFVRWLADASVQVARAPAQADRPLLRLGQVATANPSLRDAIDAFQRALGGGGEMRLQGAAVR